MHFQRLTDHNDITSRLGDFPSPPKLPQKSALRYSRLISASDTENLNTVSPSDPALCGTMRLPCTSPTLALPHQAYQSSEEEASSAGEFSDVDSASADEDDQGKQSDENERLLGAKSNLKNKAPQGQQGQQHDPTCTDVNSTRHINTSTKTQPKLDRHSHNLARVVSVVFYGRPSIINLSRGRRSYPSETALGRSFPSNSEQSLSSSLPSTATSPVSLRRTSLSYASSASSASSVSVSDPCANTALPPSNMTPCPSWIDPTPSLASVQAARAPVKSLIRKPVFLNTDPFSRPPNPAPYEIAAPSFTPPLSRTPAAILRRTLSIVKKRSTILLSTPSNNCSPPCQPAASTISTPIAQPEVPYCALGQPASYAPPFSVASSASLSSAVFSSGTIMAASPIFSQPQFPPSPRRRILSSFVTAHRRSLKAG